ncbi:pentatricopeptide repeat protein [Artemisia annua]|uniref:Pentatricopeptide repeat protein n=1 Tax=Artemisia annua TaxID=35608 RepID=A0A2U1PEH0_ARTAN|nr:pentatricopeptide repeat protein [Artemisia annua]
MALLGVLPISASSLVAKISMRESWSSTALDYLKIYVRIRQFSHYFSSSLQQPLQVCGISQLYIFNSEVAAKGMRVLILGSMYVGHWAIENALVEVVDLMLMLGKKKLIGKVKQLFSSLMKEGLKQDTRAYTELIGAYLKVDMIEKEMETYELMKASGKSVLSQPRPKITHFDVNLLPAQPIFPSLLFIVKIGMNPLDLYIELHDKYCKIICKTFMLKCLTLCTDLGSLKWGLYEFVLLFDPVYLLQFVRRFQGTARLRFLFPDSASWVQSGVPTMTGQQPQGVPFVASPPPGFSFAPDLYIELPDEYCKWKNVVEVAKLASSFDLISS